MQAELAVAKTVLVLIDWQQDETGLEESLYGLFERILTAKDQDRFLIDTTGIDQESADMMLGGALMSFLMMQKIELATEPNIGLIHPLDAAAVERFVEQHFHCAKLLCGTVDLGLEGLRSIADY
jgi:hypothetical protein